MTLSGKQVLVTGAGGFIGSHLAEALVEQGARVRALVHYRGAGTHGWLEHVPRAGEMEIVPGDLRDADAVRDAVRGCELVFHLGALIAIPYSYTAPRSYFDVNTLGTLNVCQAARELGVARLVHTSTSEVYGTARQVPIAETHPLQTQSPYAASKLAADKLVESFFHAFALPAITVRPFNTYGPRQSARAVIPTIISQALAGGPIRLGNLAPTRDLNFVSDTVAGFLAAAQAPDAALGQVFNLGSGQEISIGALAELILELTDRRLEILCDDQRLRPAGSEVERLCADAAHAAQQLNWQPRVPLREGLTQTIAWLEQNLSRYKTGEYAR